MSKPQFCFLDFRLFDNQSTVRGAALVTDSATQPLEFRCTSAVRPTLLQKTLWGGRLLGHVATELVGKPLLDALANKPSVVLVRKPEFVELRSVLQVPLVQLLRNDELAKASRLAAGDGQDDVLQSEGGQFEAVVLKAHRQYSPDVKASRELLAEVFRSFSVLEPFDRIGNALDLVHKQDAAQQT